MSILRSRIDLGPDRPFQAVAIRSDAHADALRTDHDAYPEWVRQRYLQLPESVPTRVRELGRRLSEAHDNAYDKAQAIEEALRQYTYDQGISAPPVGRDGVDYFLFDVKAGYCDYYASAFVVLMRSVGIPARFVIGYTPGEIVERPTGLQEGDDTKLYRALERNAHAWPEVFFPSYGWIQFEPTASEPVLVRPTPEPTPSSTNAGVPLIPEVPSFDGEDLPVPDDFGGGGAVADPASALGRWLARRWGWLLGGGLVLGSALAGGWLMRRRNADLFRDSRVLGRLFDLLGIWADRLRIPWPASHTPREHASAFTGSVPETGALVSSLADLYVAQRYGHREPLQENVELLARDWQQVQPVLWRQWLVGRSPGRRRQADGSKSTPERRLRRK